MEPAEHGSVADSGASPRPCGAAGMLGWSEIPARVVNVTSIVEGEYHENEIRKAFTPEERVHIGRAIEGEIGKRQGQRTARELVEKVPQVSRGTKTREAAAKLSGFGNDRTYRQAKEISSWMNRKREL